MADLEATRGCRCGWNWSAWRSPCRRAAWFCMEPVWQGTCPGASWPKAIGKTH